MSFTLGPRRAIFTQITDDMRTGALPLSADQMGHFETFDLIYRSLCAILFNYVPLSGHPGGSISSGRLVAGLLFDGLDYDFSCPEREDADILSYAAGHKAMGLYAFWALRNEVVRIAAPDLLPAETRFQLRLEDLLGFRRNPTSEAPLFKEVGARFLDGHPTPATPFLRLATGASGVGMGSSLGLALGALDVYGDDAPRVHILEGEGGMTPGRVSEAMAMAGTSSLKNVILHVDWNQASIDSNRVCRDGETPGEYVQWNPMELAYLHDWNVILVPEGRDFQQILAAQRRAKEIQNGQPTAVVYKTVKGWQYGIEGKGSHGAGHKFCSDGFYEALKPFLSLTGATLPRCDELGSHCDGGKEPWVLEECLWESLTVVRGALEKNRPMVEMLAQRVGDARNRLARRNRTPRPDRPDLGAVYGAVTRPGREIPEELRLSPGTVTTLRAELGRVLGYLGKTGRGALFAASADLYGSTNVNAIAKGFPAGFYNAVTNPGARLLSTGGICEDGMAAILSGLSSFGHHIGVGSSYAAFLAPLGHIASRLHAIGNMARQALVVEPYRPMILVCAHAGMKTGEDGPTHADPQSLQLFQENFPLGTMITLTPWDPKEVWVVMAEALAKRPAVIAPFVTRPNETVLDRQALGLAPVEAAASGLYLLRAARGKGSGTVVLQGSDVAYAFLEGALPRLDRLGIDLNVYYVSSAELFDLLPAAEQDRIFPRERAEEAMGITGFTLPTMCRWILSERGRRMSLHPFKEGHYLGSGQGPMVMKEAGLDGESLFDAVMHYVKDR